jgi:DNA recombination protein RmuC
MSLTDALLALCCVVSTIAAIFAFLAYLAGRPSVDDLTAGRITHLLRDETEIIRGVIENQHRGVRQELVHLITKFQDAIFVGFNGLRDGLDRQVKDFGGRLDNGVVAIDQKTNTIASKLTIDMETMRAEAVTNRDGLRALVEHKLDHSLAGHAEAARTLKDELSGNFDRLGARVNAALGESSQVQNERLTNVTTALVALSERLERAQEGLKTTVEGRLETIRADSAAKLEQMRATVEEKLHDTLEQRLTGSFKVVSDQLEQVFRGLGEMQTLATGVGDLKRMMTNVKARGAWGEVTLASILEHAMATDQYEKNVEVRPGSNQRVEFAVKLPGGEGGPLFLPIDAKFPTEDYERLVDASERGDAEAVEVSSKAIEMRIRHSANEISNKYVHPPYSTDFAILFLPTEGLYAEIIRRPGLADALQRDCRIIITGPTTLLALLNSLRMGFRTLAIQKRSGEVWQILAAVKTEFAKYGTILEKVQKKLQEASSTIDDVAVRRRQIDRKLRSVEVLPEMEAEGLLGVAAGFEVELPLLSESVSDPIDTMHPSNPTAGI